MASSQAQFGTVPDWIGAIGTTLAFVVAFVVLSLDLRERHRRQASHVTAWLERGRADVTLHIANSSDIPVYKVRVTPQFLGQDYETITLPLIAPQKELTPLKLQLPGGDQVSNEFLGVQIFFEDSAGRRWRRKRDGKLKRIWNSYEP
jgi:hypothetical protein